MRKAWGRIQSRSSRSSFSRPRCPPSSAFFAPPGLTALIHPLTDDDLADHTTLADWIGEPLPLDESVLDPPGHNQGIARFGKVDY